MWLVVIGRDLPKSERVKTFSQPDYAESFFFELAEELGQHYGLSKIKEDNKKEYLTIRSGIVVSKQRKISYASSVKEYLMWGQLVPEK
jgi:hypothetical protein